MNTTMKLMTLLVVALLLPTTAFALPPYSYDNYDFTVDGIYYKIVDNEAYVTYQSYSSGMHLSDYHGDVVIPASVTYQGTTYPVTAIDYYAFNYCQGLTSITIPASIRQIEGGAFYLCTRLSRVIITDLGAWFRCYINGQDGNPFLYAQHLYLNDTEVTDLVIPEGVTEISEYNALWACTELTSVTFPKSLTSVCKEAFTSAASIQSVTCKATVPPSLSIESPFHGDVYQQATLHVPVGCEQAYRSSDWGRFLTIVGDISENGSIGDVNNDGETTIADANSVIDIVVMGGNNGHTRMPAADINGDNEVNIADVNAIINMIINHQ